MDDVPYHVDDLDFRHLDDAEEPKQEDG